MSDEVSAEKLRRHLAKAASLEELSQFRSTRIWRRDDDFVGDVTSFLEPHGDEYFSTLRPLFLHEIKSIDVLAHFSPVLVRDGALGLIRFFVRHPLPPTDDMLLLVNRRLGALVPQKWRQSVAFYEASGNSEGEKRDLPGEIHCVLSLIDERQASLRWVSRQMNAIRDIFREGAGAAPALPKLKLVVFMNRAFEQKVEGFDRKTGYLFRMLDVFRHAGFEYEFDSWQYLKSRAMPGGRFVDFNEFCFYYSDSFVVQHLLRQGARPVFEPFAGEDGHKVAASMNHSFVIHRSLRPQAERSADEIRERIQSAYRSEGFRHQAQAFDSEQAFESGLKMTSLAFEEFAYDLARLTETRE
jgi:hypothetical protein